MALFTSTPVVLAPSSPFVLVDANLPNFYGGYRRAGAVWASGWNFPGAFNGLIGVFKSTDGGATWSRQDQSNSPSDINSNHGYIDFMYDGATIHALGKDTTGVNPIMTYVAFDMGAGLFGTSISSGVTNGFWKIAVYNSNPIAIYTQGTGVAIGGNLAYSIISSGVFQAPVTLVAGTGGLFYVPVGTILDTSGTLHILYSRSDAPQKLFHVALDSGGGISSSTTVDAAAATGGNPYPLGQGLYWAAQDRLLWATHADASTVVLYDGTPSTAPVWTKRTVTTLSPSSSGISFMAHVVMSGTDVYVFWYYVHSSGTPTSQVQYSIFNGSTFTSPQVAYDEYANPPAGDPGSAGGSNLDSFSIVPVAGGGFDMMALAFVTAGFDQSLIYATNAAGQSGYRNRAKLSLG